MEKAKIKLSTVDKIFKFLEKEKGKEIPGIMKYLTGETEIEIAKENLSVTKFNNGEPIPEAKTKEEWLKLGKEKTPGFMRNGDNFHYNHYAVTDERGICPPGWRIPTEDDIDYIRLKELYRRFPKAGFRRFSSGTVLFEDSDGFYWSDRSNGLLATAMEFSIMDDSKNDTHRGHGFSVRCVRDKK